MANLCTTVTGYVAKHFFFPKCTWGAVSGRNEHLNKKVQESRLPSSLWMGFVQSVEGRSRTTRQRKGEVSTPCRTV